MEEILSGYKVEQSTWFYLSFFLILSVYFRFSRVVSLRNADLLILLAIAPGLLLARNGLPTGYVWLFAVSGVLLVRLACDGYFTRRPRLDQNLNTQGLSFLGVVAFVFLSAAAWNVDRLPESTVRNVEAANRLTRRQEAPKTVSATATAPTDDAKSGPAATVLTVPFVKIPELAAINPSADYVALAARLASMVAHLAVVIALVCIARWHFGDQQVGVAMATLYLLLPGTSYDVAHFTHVLPAALILWAIAAYRRPAVAGSLMGLACGTLIFPVFLLPLWFAFYDRRGAIRFGIALGAVGAILGGSFILTSVDTASFRNQIIGAIDWGALVPSFRSDENAGFWQNQMAAYRVPVFVAFCGAATVLTFWPRKKTLEELISHSAAIIVGTQFWYPQQGGVYMLWYLPLVLVVVFRPPLNHLLPPDLSHKGAAEQSKGNGNPRELVRAGSNGIGGTPLR